MMLPMERPLYTRVHKSALDSDDVRDAEEQTDPSVLFEQVYVDPGPLRGNVHRALRRQSSVVLTALIQEQPLTKGLAELVTYLSLKDEAFSIVFDEQQREQVSWTDGDFTRTATLPRVIYARRGTS
jgi:hypothetical protein